MGNGGAQKLTAELCNEMVKNHEVILCPFRDIEDWMFFPKILDKRVRIISLSKREKGFDFSIFFKLNHLIRKEKPDIIHIQATPVLKYVFPFTLIYNRVSFVYTIHTKLLASNRKYFEFVNRYFYKFNKIKYVTLSKSIQYDFVHAFPRLAFSSISNGIVPMHTTSQLPEVKKEFNQYKLNKDSKIAIAIGRVAPAKNYGMMLKAFEMLKSENIIAVVIGDKERGDEEILKAIHAYSLNNVFFIGKKENVGDYISQADVFFMTSTHEGIPITALEALSMGIPIVSTPAGGMVDIVEPGKNGFLSRDFTAESFAEAMKIFLSLDGEQVKKMKTNARKTFEERYDIATCAGNYLSLYKDLL